MASTFQTDVEDLLRLLRNGSAVVGDSLDTAKYRTRCLKLAFHRACTIIIPELVAKGIISSNEPLENLIDISILFQNQSIDASENEANQ